MFLICVPDDNLRNNRALLFNAGPPRKSNDVCAAEREGSLTAFYGNDAIKALVSSSVANYSVLQLSLSSQFLSNTLSSLFVRS
jgi:hypothetical protein